MDPLFKKYLKPITSLKTVFRLKVSKNEVQVIILRDKLSAGLIACDHFR